MKILTIGLLYVIIFVIIEDKLHWNNDVKEIIYRCKMEMREASWCPNWYLASGDPKLKESEKIKLFNKACECEVSITM